jgi:hypothetical protein
MGDLNYIVQLVQLQCPVVLVKVLVYCLVQITVVWRRLGKDLEKTSSNLS